MSCQTVPIGDTVVTICYGAEHRVIKNESQGELWCFHCRKRREFFFIVTAPVEPDWYGPNADIKCGHCNTSDGDLFPGREREWE